VGNHTDELPHVQKSTVKRITDLKRIFKTGLLYQYVARGKSPGTGDILVSCWSISRKSSYSSRRDWNIVDDFASLSAEISRNDITLYLRT
jgi:hypothetical protein